MGAASARAGPRPGDWPDEFECALGDAGIEGYVEGGGTRRASDEHSINVASRRARVSGRLALATQQFGPKAVRKCAVA